MGIPDHEWQERRKAIADTIDTLGEDYRKPLRDGWLKYIREFYSEGSAASPGALKCNLGATVLDEDD